VKHDGHRLVAIVAGGELRLLSRNRHDRTKLFREPFRALTAAGLPALVLDGEIAVPDGKGITHIEQVSESLPSAGPTSSPISLSTFFTSTAYDLRPCPIEDRKARDVVGAAG
jgi:bifunctional non-homologous end joining protein LigD